VTCETSAAARRSHESIAHQIPDSESSSGRVTCDSMISARWRLVVGLDRDDGPDVRVLADAQAAERNQPDQQQQQRQHGREHPAGGWTAPAAACAASARRLDGNGHAVAELLLTSGETTFAGREPRGHLHPPGRVRPTVTTTRSARPATAAETDAPSTPGTDCRLRNCDARTVVPALQTARAQNMPGFSRARRIGQPGPQRQDCDPLR